MDLQLFHNALSENESIRAQAYESIMHSLNTPSFMSLMLESLQNPEIQSTPQLFRFFTLTVLQQIRLHWDQAGSENEAFWNQEEKDSITNSLNNMLFSIPNELRADITECFRSIIYGSFPNNLPFAEGLVNLYDSATQAQDLNILLQLTYFWSKACASLPFPDELTIPIDTINLNFVHKFISIASTSIDEITDYGFLRYIAKSIHNMLKKLNSAIFSEHFDAILLLFINSLQIQTEVKEILPLKRAVISLFITLNSHFFNPQDDTKLQYSEHYKAEVSPKLLETIIKVLPTERNSWIISHILYLFSQFLHYKVCSENILTNEFISGWLIPLARLNQEDINEIIVNPSQFLAFQYSFDSSLQFITPRSAVAQIVNIILKEYGFIDELYDFFTAPATDYIDYEGRVYLLTQFIRSTMSDQGPMIDSVDKYIEEIRSFANNEELIYLRASLIIFMANVLPDYDPELGINIAIESIAQSDNVIIVCTASKLLRKCVIGSESETLELPVVEIVNKLLQYTEEYHLRSFIKTIEILVRSAGAEVYPCLAPIISQFLSVFECCFEEEKKSAESALLSVFHLLNAIPDDAGILEELAPVVLPECLQLMTKYLRIDPNNDQSNKKGPFPTMYLILSAFTTKIDQLTDEIVQYVLKVIEIIINDEAELSEAQEIAFMIAPVILSSVTQAHPEYYDIFHNIFDKLFTISVNDSITDAQAYSLLIAAALIQALPEHASTYLEYALNSMSNVQGESETNLFSSIVFVIGSALLADLSICDALSADVINTLIQNINSSTLQTYKELKMGFILLLNISQKSHFQAYVGAVKNISDLCTLELDPDFDQDQKASFSPLIVPFILPSDQIDIGQLFADVTKKTGYFKKLQPQLQRIVRDNFE